MFHCVCRDVYHREWLSGYSEIRAGYRDHFRHYWNEKCPRVCNHDIVLEQREDSLSMSSDMELYNPYEESLNQLILFLNPGLQVKTLMVENKEIPFQREGQVLVDSAYFIGKRYREFACTI